MDSIYGYVVKKVRVGEAKAKLSELMARAGYGGLTHGLRIVTGNERHFRRAPNLEVENWLAG